MTDSTIPSRFPRALLTQSPADRLSYFKAYTVAHPALDQADKAVWSALREPAGAALVFVFGPTGVGKTTLLSHIEASLTVQALPTLEQDRGWIPVVKLQAVASAVHPFKWSDFYKRALMAVDEPLLEYKIGASRDELSRRRARLWTARRSMDVADLRLAWEQALLHRHPTAVLIDEAQHMARTASGAKLQDQLDHLKSLAIMSQTVHVLVGTYGLLIFRNVSAQLSRRSIDIHFPRYHADRPEDVRAFKSVLWDFQRHLPLEQEPHLVPEWKYFYALSVGCVGTLKDWLTKALAEALETGAPTLTFEMMARYALTEEQCDQMTTDALEGEAQLERRPETTRRLWQRLGLGTPSAYLAETRKPQETPTDQKETRKARGRTAVGQRNPRRDPLKVEVPDESAS